MAGRSAVAVLGLLIAGLSSVAHGQDRQFHSHRVTFGTHRTSFNAHRITFSAHAATFDTHRATLTTHAITFPTSSMTAAVDETPKYLRFRLSGDVLFDFDKADIRPTAEPVLADLAAKIRAGFGGAPVRVEGHTDSKGSDAYNQRLSERRARSVKLWLGSEGGLPARSISMHGYGEKRPVAPNTRKDGSDDPAGRQQNRRVEIVVEKRR